MQAISNDLQPLENGSVLFDLHLISENEADIPSTILPGFQRNGQTDSNGHVSIENITFANGLSGLYFIRPILIYPLVDNFTNLNLSSDLWNMVSMIINPDTRELYSLDDYDSFMDGLNTLSDMELLSFCYGDILNFTLVTQIGSIILLNDTQSSLRFKLNETYFFQFRIYSQTYQLLSQTKISLNFNLIHFPSYLASDYLFNGMAISIINFSQIYDHTDENGEILIQ